MKIIWALLYNVLLYPLIFLFAMVGSVFQDKLRASILGRFRSNSILKQYFSSFNPNIENQESENVIIRQGHYINNQTFTPQTIPHPEYPGWNHNKLILNKTNLETVCDQIERKFDVNIILESIELNRISITGVIEAKDLDGVLTTLAILSQRSYRFEKETYIFY